MKIDSFSGKYRFLSNFFPCEITYEGITYPSVEHAFQAAKSLDLKERKSISELKTPGQAKKYGKQVNLRQEWEKIKFDVMETLVRQKFSTTELKEKLLKTGKADLEEGNTWGDTTWGVYNGIGDNHLGKILMKIRGTITTPAEHQTALEEIKKLFDLDFKPDSTEGQRIEFLIPLIEDYEKRTFKF